MIFIEFLFGSKLNELIRNPTSDTAAVRLDDLLGEIVVPAYQFGLATGVALTPSPDTLVKLLGVVAPDGKKFLDDDPSEIYSSHKEAVRVRRATQAAEYVETVCARIATRIKDSNELGDLPPNDFQEPLDAAWQDIQYSFACGVMLAYNDPDTAIRLADIGAEGSASRATRAVADVAHAYVESSLGDEEQIFTSDDLAAVSAIGTD
ncbi:MAG TPA: hypothetical protein QGI07_00405 [Dehalococcoidia bacterium]|jgi:hypothetical protein|nr:hypothetical protein [Chloroflexota bacterium]MDP5876356.1 hypothetical protein [Dehalococcoidia bacterium]MDP6273920.1 hypothetical protein [Dehalococcoidia bacterium]MDP7212544.1 hypothetical protein [Dehalococcoidia bacterium]MDP7514309.1 hypothetical protein [Dehalococcoidia bacterium]